MSSFQFTCSKCGNGTCRTGEFRAPGNTWMGMMHIYNQRFTTLTCTRCFYTEVYKVSRNIFERDNPTLRI